MAKISVADAANKAKLNPDEFLKKLKEFGIYAEDKQSTFDSSKLAQVLSLLKQEDRPGVEKVEKRISSGVMRRRRSPKKKEAKPEVQEVPVQNQETASAQTTDISASQEQPEISSQITQEAQTPSADAGQAIDITQETPEVDSDVQPEENVNIAVESESIEEASQQDLVEKEDQEKAEELPGSEVEKEVGPEEKVKGKKKSKLELSQESSAINEKEDETEGQRGKKGRKSKERKAKTRKIPIRGVTKEPARIVSLPDRKIETLKPVPYAEEPSPKKSDGPPPAGDQPGGDERRGKKGRRVVEVGRRGADRKKKKEVFEKNLSRGRGKKKKREVKSTEITTPKAFKRKIKVMEQIQVGDMAHRMGIKAGDLMRKLISLGVMATINQYIDFDTATLIAEEYGFEIENISVVEDDIFKLEKDGEEKGSQVSRSPVVTIMGHVDHGKTTLLDTIRKANVVKGEAGGITQHIGAYNVDIGKGQIVFLDTPGHETFTAMRARGAQVTDIVVLIVAADDGVMPQTIEAINHSKDAGVPIIVAINKIDKPNADSEKIRQRLTEHGLVSEEWGGDTIFAEISAKSNIGIEGLLEAILLQAEMMELTAVADSNGHGIIIESRLEKGRGPVATVLVKEGTLKIGDPIVADKFWGRVRSMQDDRGNRVDFAGPSTPVEVVGLGGVPAAGVSFNATKDERLAKQVAEMRDKKAKESEQKTVAKVSLEDLYSSIKEGGLKELKLIVKGDVQGSVEAINDTVEKISNDEVKIKVVHSGAGAISETDINFAIASSAIVIGFNVRPEPKARVLAEREKIDIRLYEVIYDLVNDIKDALSGMLEPTFEEKIIGRVEVRNTFHISRIGTIAGCHVTDGKVIRNSKCRLIRDGVIIHNGKISTLKRFKDDAKEVLSGFECGITIDGYNDVKIGDVIEGYEMKMVAPQLKP